MVWKYFVLDKFVTSHISDQFLRNVDDNLKNIQAAGFTATIRFCYTFTMALKAPYGDANKYWILEHIKQLKPMFHKHEGVLTSVQAGFIGTWGEWYYTTHFGDPLTIDYHKYPKYGYPENLWQDRKDVFTALLDAVPKSIEVQLRHPKMKVDMWNDETPTTYVDFLKRNNKARTAHHNDCFLASDNDVGTYQNKTFEYPYMQNDTRYCIVGGETCIWRSDNHKRSDCPSAINEMAMFHWTFLNQNFYRGILDSWKNQGCYTEIHRRLGYKLSLKRVILPKVIKSGDSLCYEILIKNSGFAAPAKLMNIYLLLRSQKHGHFYAGQMPINVRTWIPGEPIELTGSFAMPTSMIEDNYDVYLAIGDKILHGKADYYILFANHNVPVYSAGYNNLHHTIHIAGSHPNGVCQAILPLWTPPTPSRYPRLFKGSMTQIIG
ncbi:uncharacterized protein LOC126817563 [Patella vulgata]|uniref:uncharacterized protein LOC126817563 n=1 Tax=Patella vulgata TaxID=6465 RepID=UPI00217F299C|nr:uncharacterized protein LOC126817563 [Patella vulgata]